MSSTATETTGLAAATGTWVIDPAHTSLAFSARHAMVAKVRGNFGEFSGSFTIDGANPANSTAELTIQAASIDTKSADRGGDEGQRRVGLDVEEVGRLQVGVAISGLGVDAGGLDGELGRGLGGVGAVDGERAG